MGIGEVGVSGLVCFGKRGLGVERGGLDGW